MHAPLISAILAASAADTPTTAAAAIPAQEPMTLVLDPSRLTGSLIFQGGGVDVGALIRSSYANLDDDLTDADGDDDHIDGWVFQDVDVWIEGLAGDFDWRVNVDFDGNGDFDTVDALPLFQEDFEAVNEAFFTDLDGYLLFGGGLGGDSAKLEDAYADWNLNEEHGITWGQFKFPTLLSNQVDPENQLFINRSILGTVFDDWDLGAMMHGDYENFGWYAAVQNGADGATSGNRYSARGEFHLGQRTGGTGGRQGARGAPDDFAATFGLVASRDDGLQDIVGEDTMLVGVDAAATLDRMSAQLEVAKLDDGLGDTTPYGASFGFLIRDDMEAAVRYQNMQNAIDTQFFEVAFNYYIGPGKATAQIVQVEADGPVDGTAFLLGFSLGASRKN